MPPRGRFAEKADDLCDVPGSRSSFETGSRWTSQTGAGREAIEGGKDIIHYQIYPMKGVMQDGKRLIRVAATRSGAQGQGLAATRAFICTPSSLSHRLQSLSAALIS